MLDYIVKNGSTSNKIRVRLYDALATDENIGLTGLTSASAGLLISTITDNEATATTYSQSGSTIETITTLGAYAAPTATKCRFKEVDSTNHKGLYEIQLADARYAVSGATGLIVSISGVTDQVEQAIRIQLDSKIVSDLNDVAATDIVSSGAITTSGGIASSDVKKINGTTITGAGAAGNPFNV